MAVTNEALKQQIESLRELIELRLATLEDENARNVLTIQRMDADIRGNGKQGIRERLGTLEGFMHNTQKITWFIALFVLGDIAARLFEIIYN